MRLGLLLSLPALLLNPVVITVDFGQVNLVVTLLVMWDLLSHRRIGSWQAPLGVATGLAAAVKLTPILFVPYLILTRRTRGAVTCVVTFVVCELVTFLLSPTSSRAYWTHALFKPGRAGNLSYVGDQNLMAAVERLHHGLVTNLALLPVLAAVAAGGLWLAALAHRRSSPMLGLLICAATGLLVSPISWVHHMVWVIPAILWLGLAKDRPRFGVPLAIGTAVLFWIAPIWWVPYVSASDLHLNAWQLVAGNSFFFAVVLFVVGAAVLLTRRRSNSQSGGGQPLVWRRLNSHECGLRRWDSSPPCPLCALGGLAPTAAPSLNTASNHRAVEVRAVISSPSRVAAAATDWCRFGGAPSSNSFQKTDQPPAMASLRATVISSRARVATALGRPTSHDCAVAVIRWYGRWSAARATR